MIARPKISPRAAGAFTAVDKATELQELHMGGTSITPVTLLLVQELPKLVSLGLQGCEGVQELPNEAPASLLRMNISSLQFIPEHRLAAWLQPVFHQLLSLQAAESMLSLAGLTTLVGQAAQAAAAASAVAEKGDWGSTEQKSEESRHHLAMQQLDLSWCEKMEEISLVPFLELLPQLQHLTLRTQYFSDEMCTALAKNCPLLEHLTVARASGPTASDSGMLALSGGCSRLRFLNISWNTDVTDTGIGSVLRQCSDLAHFVLEGVKRLTDDGIMSALASAPSSSLRVLDLSWVNTCDEKLVQSIQAQHPYVEVIDYYTNSHEAPKSVPPLVLAQPYTEPLTARA